MNQPKSPDGNKKRGQFMNIHKSLGLCMAFLIPLRLGMRFSSVHARTPSTPMAPPYRPDASHDAPSHDVCLWSY